MRVRVRLPHLELVEGLLEVDDRGPPPLTEHLAVLVALDALARDGAAVRTALVPC